MQCAAPVRAVGWDGRGQWEIQLGAEGGGVLRDVDESETRNPRRIVVVGCTSSGKTTLAGRLARQLGVPHIELDAFRWDADWTEAPDDLFRERVVRELDGEAGWVADGNYPILEDIIFNRADTAVWLDYPLARVFAQVFLRSLRRSLHREELWNGNRETFGRSFFSRDSVVLWALRSYLPVRGRFRSLYAGAKYPSLRRVRLRSHGEADAFLDRLAQWDGDATSP